MAEVDLTNIADTSISTPGSGVTAVFADSTGKVLAVKDDAGYQRSLGRANFSTALQLISAATRTYLTGSSISVPTNKLQVGTMFRWRISMTKDANGVAASTFDVAVGTNGTTGDTARVSFTKPGGSAAADEGFVEIFVTVRSIGAAGVMVGEFTMTHNLASTGHMVIPGAVVNTISSGFDMTVANLIVGICLTSGAADAITIQLVQAEAVNL